MITVIENYNLEDVKTSINHLLRKASESEEVRQLTISVVGDCPDPIPPVYDFIRYNVKYISDPIGGELFISPVKMVNDYSNDKPIGADCDDMAILAVAMYRSVGLESNVVLLDTKGKGLDHAVARVRSRQTGEYIMIDPSTPKYPLGWQERYYAKVII